VKFFLSLKTTLLLVFFLASLLVIGTLIPQGLPWEKYQEMFSPKTLSLLKVLGFFDIYRSYPFLILSGLLGLNVLLCTFLRIGLPKRGMSLKNWGTYLTHLSLLVVIAGAIVTGSLGFKGYMEILKGESSQVVISGERAFGLPFSVKCEDFQIKYWPNGTPREFLSRLSFWKNGNLLEVRDLKVNHPIRFEGLTFYQSHYGEKVLGEFLFKKDGKNLRLFLSTGEMKKVDDNLRVILMKRLQGKVLLGLFFPGKAPEAHWIKEGESLKVDDFIIAFLGERSYMWTGIQVSHDPGAVLVFLGAFCFMVGLGLNFYGRAKR